jgi:uncharacterized protein (TIGR02246 family)
MKTVLTRIGPLVVMVVLGACSQPPAPAPQPVEPPDTRAADEAAIRAAVKEWAAAAAAKDAEKFGSFYAEDATLMLENAPDLKGATTIRGGVGGMMQDANFALSFETTAVQVARSGDLAYELGTYSMTTTSPKTRKPAAEKGSYVVVWKKQADGKWKAIVDAPVSDPAS